MSTQATSENATNLWVPAVFISTFVVIMGITLAALPPASRPALSTSPAQIAQEVQVNAATPPANDMPVSVEREPKLVSYTLRTNVGGTPVMSFVGVGGVINSMVNPTLTAEVGDRIQITIIDGDGSMHDLVIPDLNIHTEHLTAKDAQTVVEFVVEAPGNYAYYCSIPGHKDIGMVGVLRVTGEAKPVAASDTHTDAGSHAAEVAAAVPVQPADVNAVSIVRNPADLPSPVGNREPMTLHVDLTTQEVSGVLADGTTYPYFTFDGKVPGPMLRVRVGDTVELTLNNAADSLFPHSIDLHAVTGPGGGAVFTQTTPGAENTFTFKALNPGLYVYHCATASIPHHIASGMYGLILVEPEGGLPAVDHEYYVMQGEIYTDHPFGTKGNLGYSADKASHEEPEYMVFNGAAGALTADDTVLRAEVGETIRIYFGVGGPNYTSSFHVIGEIFDRVYDQASLTSNPLTNVQTALVPPGGATMVEFKVDVPGRYILVDHALSRLERGLAAYLIVEGGDQPEIFHSKATPNMSGH
jgi:nitrite reductase (NO-forming)